MPSPSLVVAGAGLVQQFVERGQGQRGAGARGGGVHRGVEGIDAGDSAGDEGELGGRVGRRLLRPGDLDGEARVIGGRGGLLGRVLFLLGPGQLEISLVLGGLHGLLPDGQRGAFFRELLVGGADLRGLRGEPEVFVDDGEAVELVRHGGHDGGGGGQVGEVLGVVFDRRGRGEQRDDRGHPGRDGGRQPGRAAGRQPQADRGPGPGAQFRVWGDYGQRAPNGPGGLGHQVPWARPAADRRSWARPGPDRRRR